MWTAGSGRSRRRRAGFTLIELLTVMAIVAILATLMLTAVSSAKKASHRARCTSNLRQISLALNMYIDDFEKRSPDLGRLTSSRYLADRQVLLCPADRTGGWGNRVNPAPLTEAVVGSAIRGGTGTNNDAGVIPFSYLNPLPWEDWAWVKLNKLGNQVGVAVCQLHGLGKPNLEQPSYKDFQGVILRAQRDGAVVKREVYWDRATLIASAPPPGNFEAIGPPGDLAAASTDKGTPVTEAGATSTYDYPWKLYTDEPNP